MEYPSEALRAFRFCPEVLCGLTSDWLDHVLADLRPFANSDAIADSTVNLATSPDADVLIDAAWAESKRLCSLIPIKRLCDLVGEHL